MYYYPKEKKEKKAKSVAAATAKKDQEIKGARAAVPTDSVTFRGEIPAIDGIIGKSKVSYKFNLPNKKKIDRPHPR